MPRSGGRSMAKNHLDGTLPAELGKLTNLEFLCVTRAAAQPSADRSAPRAYALRWCAASVPLTSSAARSAAGSARWRISLTCERPAHRAGMLRCAGTADSLVPYATLWAQNRAIGPSPSAPSSPPAHPPAVSGARYSRRGKSVLRRSLGVPMRARVLTTGYHCVRRVVAGRWRRIA